jgi:hypothetical protein
MIQPKHPRTSNNTSAASVASGTPGELSPRMLNPHFMFAGPSAAGWSLSQTATLESELTGVPQFQLGLENNR